MTLICITSSWCPQCVIKMECSLKDVRKLYASQVVDVEEESQKVNWVNFMYQNKETF